MILRPSSFKVTSNSTFQVEFTDNLDQLINTGNVIFETSQYGIDVPEVLKVTVKDNVLKVKTRPIPPFVTFNVLFISTSIQKFQSRNGESYLIEDGKNNLISIVGLANYSRAKENLKNYLIDSNVYDVDNPVNNSILDAQAKIIDRAYYDVQQYKNDNYLSLVVENERKIRGSGTVDRLNEEGAFEILKVSKKLNSDKIAGLQNFESFPYYPVTLQSVTIANEKLLPGVTSKTFDKLTLRVSKFPIIKVNSVRIVYGTGDIFNYEVSDFGYQIKDNRYDPENASSYLLLEDNEIILSDKILAESGFVQPTANDLIYIDYEYKHLGKIIDSDSVVVSQVLPIIRETCPPILTVFNLGHYPIVTSNDTNITSDGVIFLDPQSNPPFSEIHPAFSKEIPFRTERLPNYVGEYCVDYETGTVYCYGAVTNDGTGDFPPTATYYYRKSFVNDLDYTYEPFLYELVRSPLRDLEGEVCKISYTYTSSLVSGIDYIAQIHTESLNERVNNKIGNTSVLFSEHGPITDVFRIYNETTGEVYRIDGWRDNSIFYTATNPPNLGSVIEKASFTNISNETLIVTDDFVNSTSVRVFKILLNNNRIISASEDSIGSSFNSSVFFSQTDLFAQELYWDGQSVTPQVNIDRLINEGEYLIDYSNGVVYVAVGISQDLDIGTVSYKKSTVTTKNNHIFAVKDIYFSLDSLNNQKIDYTNFTDTEIQLSSFEISDERSDGTNPYIYDNGFIVVSDDINEIRGIYDHYQLMNNINPVNFAVNSTFNNTIITVGPVDQEGSFTVQSGLTVNVTNLSPGIEIAEVYSVIRISDNVELYDSGGSFSDYTITLSGVNGAANGQAVYVRYSIKMDGASTPIIDYSKGDLLIDYQYVNDEIIISYEYGDNSIDFSQSGALNEGEEYFVSYKFGALRSALLRNFGSLVSIPILNNLDVTLDRERYRDALKAALHSFTKGPTLSSFKNLVKNITHIEPELIEAIFEHWVLGYSYLSPRALEVTGNPKLLAGKFDNGVLVSNSDETISLPMSSNFRLEEGSLETWVIPQWDGIDNDAVLTFTLLKDGVLLDVNDIFIGSDSHHPEYTTLNTFSVTKEQASGLPSAIFTNSGVFVTYNTDEKRWNVYFKAFSSVVSYFSGTITSSGEIYDVKAIAGLNDPTDIIRSAQTEIEFEMHIDGYDSISPDGYSDGELAMSGYSFDGITFQSDEFHYFFDFGKENNRNRVSLFKDGAGYLVFGVYDKNKNYRYLSKDIHEWSAGEKHHIGMSWKINSAEQKDEMHLFVDGFEVPNILKFGGRPSIITSDKLRTVRPEILISSIPNKIIFGEDMQLSAGSTTIYSTNINFQSEGIVPGNIVEFIEFGLGSYTIATVNNNILTVTVPIPLSFSNAKFTINPYTAVVSSEINLYKNIVVSLVRAGEEIELPGLRAENPYYSISRNALNQDILTILGGANSGDQIAIRTLGLNYRRLRENQFVYGNSNILKTQLPTPMSLPEVKIYPIIFKLTPIGPSNAVLSVNTFTATNLAPTTQPSNSSQGRTLSVRVTGSNTNYANPVSVTILGTPTNETIVFNAPGAKNSVNKFTTVTGVTIVTTAYDTAQNSTAVEIKELYSMMYSEGNSDHPVLRYSTQVSSGTSTLSCTGSIFTDLTQDFIESDAGQYIVVTSPPAAVGTYTVLSRIDNHNVIVESPPAAFANGTYKIYHVALGSSGFFNGFFTFEHAGTINSPFLLNRGFYEFDYSANLTLPFDPISNEKMFIGSSRNSDKQAKAIIDEFRILSTKLTDVRVGETSSVNEDSFTKSFTRISPFRKNKETLTLLHFNERPFQNDSDYWTFSDRDFIQSADGVNENFDKSLVITNKPLELDNKGILSTESEGTIEFWVNPRFDTVNDPNYRYYFDASSAAVEIVVSTNSSKIVLEGSIKSVISIVLANNPGVDFSGDCVLLDDNTIQLTQALPYQNTPVKVSYVTKGTNGDRLSIYKDPFGFLNFTVRIKEIDYTVSQFVPWARDTWHRVMATYKFNRKDNNDEIRLFVDGEEGGTITFGQGYLFGQGLVFGQRTGTYSPLNADLNFSDNINTIYIGTDYIKNNGSFARFDNIRFSNKSRNPTIVAGQSKDVNYNASIDVVLPVVEDLYTTKLLNFDTIQVKNKDFAILRNDEYGIFNFTLNVIDSFDFVLSSDKVKQILEILIDILKPASSKVTVNYFQ